MAFNGITLHALARELQEKLTGGRIVKIAQPEPEELILTIKNNGEKFLLQISANASLPLIYLTSENKKAPLTAPNFCMLLRKYIGNSQIDEIRQIDFERVLCFKISHLNELGDPAVKYLYVEIMGKHSNIIFCDQDQKILDAIKRIPAQVSSVREVLPGREYFIPAQENKYQPNDINRTRFMEDILSRPVSIFKAILSSVIGFSSTSVQQLCTMAGVDSDASTASLSSSEKADMYDAFTRMLATIEQTPSPIIYLDAKDRHPVEFCAYPLLAYEGYCIRDDHNSVSEVLEQYFAKKALYSNMKQRSSDLRRSVKTLLERESKKLDLQIRQMKDTEKMEQYRVYGELLHTYGYQIPEGETSATVTNYYDNRELTIPLDPQKSAMENAQRYFDKYTKCKRTRVALTEQIKETEKTVEHLSAILNSLEIAESSNDLDEIRRELEEFGYIHKHAKNKKEKAGKSHPLHFVTEDGFHIYVGKNNYQNDALTFKKATGNDWWFHAKKIPGSHVIVKTEGEELPDDVFMIAAELAGYYSSGKDSEKLEIDYLQKKNVKKPSGAAPGFVIYYTNYSMMIHPQIRGVKRIED
ncbi:MAG: NFACT family protein [Lachnospiraceae bacterium]|nr:NFACT family protein [Lachnospiraceae bacterium]